MRTLLSNASRFFVALATCLVLTLPALSHARAVVDERPTGTTMVADLIIARPLLMVATALGVGFYAVSLPFALLGGNALEAGNTLVVGPAKGAFLRCLGCTHGRKEKIVKIEDQ